MAAQCYLGAWELAQKTSRYLELAIAILEIAIRRSKYRFQIRVLLIRLYQIAGAASLVLKHYKLMDTKQVQYDTLGHWALERGCTFFAPPDTGKQGAPLIVDGEVNTFPHTLESTSAWYSKADEEVCCFKHSLCTLVLLTNAHLPSDIIFGGTGLVKYFVLPCKQILFSRAYWDASKRTMFSLVPAGRLFSVQGSTRILAVSNSSRARQSSHVEYARQSNELLPYSPSTLAGIGWVWWVLI